MQLNGQKLIWKFRQIEIVQRCTPFKMNVLKWGGGGEEFQSISQL